MATATRPAVGGVTEIESADDFVLTHSASISRATFTGLLPAEAPLTDIKEVVVEIYRVFPKDSHDPPSMKVPTRVNSPSDVSRSKNATSTSGLTFTPDASCRRASPVANSVQPGGIHLPSTPPQAATVPSQARKCSSR